jgi:hypothetical protein
MLRTTADMLKDKRKIILVHGNADMDAFCSAYALSKSFPPAVICAPGGMDRVTKSVIEKIMTLLLSLTRHLLNSSPRGSLRFRKEVS